MKKLFKEEIFYLCAVTSQFGNIIRSGSSFLGGASFLPARKLAYVLGKFLPSAEPSNLPPDPP